MIRDLQLQQSGSLGKVTATTAPTKSLSHKSSGDPLVDPKPAQFEPKALASQFSYGKFSSMKRNDNALMMNEEKTLAPK